MLRSLRRIIISLFCLTTALSFFAGLSISQYAKTFSDTPSDAAIVLGASIWGDKPSPVFKARIDHAINLHQQGKVKYLIFTGAIGKGERFAEAKIAKNYALGQGVKASNVLIETRSKITFENLEEAKKLLDEKQLETVLIVSDPLHMKRAMTMAEDLNIKARTSPTPTSFYKTWRTKSGFLAREIFFYIGYLVLG